MLAEPAVTLSDYLLTAQCAWSAWWCWRRQGRARGWFTVFFASLSAAAVLGGTMHGFFPDEGAARELLWLATLLSIGLTSLAMWGMAGAIAASPRSARMLILIGGVLFACYAVAVIGGSRLFTMALGIYLPPALVLLAALIIAQRRSGDRRFAWGFAGVVLTFVAAGIQASGFDVDPRWCDHNALYHLVQMAALAGVWASARAVLPPRPATDPHA